MATGWLSSIVQAPAHATCSRCGRPVTGTDYIWRGHFPLMADFQVEFAHPGCVEGATTEREQTEQP